MSVDIRPAVDRIVKKIYGRAEALSFQAANELRNSELSVLRGKRSGRVYRRPASRRKYTASAPGEPPAVRSGILRNSWGSRTSSVRAGKTLILKPSIATSIKYARYLEDGTKKMAPRPYQDKIIEHAVPRVLRIYKNLHRL